MKKEADDSNLIHSRCKPPAFYIPQHEKELKVQKIVPFCKNKNKFKIFQYVNV